MSSRAGGTSRAGGDQHQRKECSTVHVALGSTSTESHSAFAERWHVEVAITRPSNEFTPPYDVSVRYRTIVVRDGRTMSANHQTHQCRVSKPPPVALPWGTVLCGTRQRHKPTNNKKNTTKNKKQQTQTNNQKQTNAAVH